MCNKLLQQSAFNMKTQGCSEGKQQQSSNRLPVLCLVMWSDFVDSMDYGCVIAFTLSFSLGHIEVYDCDLLFFDRSQYVCLASALSYVLHAEAHLRPHPDPHRTTS